MRLDALVRLGGDGHSSAEVTENRVAGSCGVY